MAYRIYLISALAIFELGNLCAQDTQVAGPLPALVFEPASRSVRPVVGWPGSAYLGPATLKQVDFASAAPGGDWVFAIKEGRVSFLWGLRGAEPIEHAPPSLLASVDRVSWSRNARYAILQSVDSALLQRIELLENQVHPGPPIDIRSLGAKADVLAVDPAGRQVIIGVEGSGVFSLSPDGAPALLAPLQEPKAALFASDGKTLYVLDGQSARVLAFRDTLFSFEFPLVTSGLPLLVRGFHAEHGARRVSSRQNDQLLQPVGLALSSDDRRLFVVDRSGLELREYDAASGTLLSEIQLDYAPASIEFVGRDLHLIRPASDFKGALMLLDSRQPAVYFLPSEDTAAR